MTGMFVPVTRVTVLLLILASCEALKHHDFRKCADTPFCEKHRAFNPSDHWTVDGASVKLAAATLTAKLRPPKLEEPLLPLLLSITVLKSGALRIHADEDPDIPLESLTKADPAVAQPEEWDEDMDGPWDAPEIKLGRAVKRRFSPAAALASDGVLAHVSSGCDLQAVEAGHVLRCSNGDDALGVEVRLHHEPLSITIIDRDGESPAAVLNGRGKLLFEPFRQAVASGTAEAASITPPHTFNGHNDPMVYGSSSVGLDITLPQATHAYGLPERTVSHDLPSTLGKSEPYRLFNLDVFEYELDHPMTVYGSVPFLHAHGDKGSYGLLWLNPSESFVDLGCPSDGDGDATSGVCSHWYSASGTIDLFVFIGETPSDVTRQHAALTGVTPLPPLFSLGYHQCRWNYRDERDVSQVHGAFEEHGLPFDVLWLDIEHTDGKRYFTWDPSKFATPLTMQSELAHTGRKMVTIIDPHLKADSDYPVFEEAKQRNLLVLKEDNATHFEGDCWPGRSAWVDYLLPEARAFWSSRFTSTNYVGSSSSLYTWNDMNEPSVFDGPEITMRGNLVHRSGVNGETYEHRELHNLYGMLMHMSTYDGQRQAYPDRRPFVLTRAFFAGSQRYAAVWTGDNKASWAHLAATTPMLLSLSVAGIPFVGADVGGFFGNPSTKLLVRWYQAAVFHPFLRAHAEFKTKRREPYLFGDEVTAQVRHALKLRYSLLPYLYTLFANHRDDGSLVMRPMWYEFPADDKVRGAPWWLPKEAPKATTEMKAEVKAEPDTAVEADKSADPPEEEAEKKEADEVTALDDGAKEPCPCFKCGDMPCGPPECGKCGTKEASGCRVVNGVNYPEWGCYTTADKECSCDKEDFGLGEDERYDEESDRFRDYGDDIDPDEYDPDDPYGRDKDYDRRPSHWDEEDDYGEGGNNNNARGLGEEEEEYEKTDYNAEYYHGDGNKDDSDQDETQRLTGEQFLLGSSLLVQPITSMSAQSTSVYLPSTGGATTASLPWYDLHTGLALVSTPERRVFEVELHADRVPAYLKGGTVLPTRERMRRSSASTHVDPFTLTVAPDATGSAVGELFLDKYDGYDESVFTRVTFTLEGSMIKCTVKSGEGGSPPAAGSGIERIRVRGQTASRKVIVRKGSEVLEGVEVQYEAESATLLIRQPRVSVGEEWSIELV